MSVHLRFPAVGEAIAPAGGQWRSSGLAWVTGDGARSLTRLIGRAAPSTRRTRASSVRCLANSVSSPRSPASEPPELMSHLLPTLGPAGARGNTRHVAVRQVGYAPGRSASAGRGGTAG